eukprot:gene16332-22521_t
MCSSRNVLTQEQDLEAMGARIAEPLTKGRGLLRDDGGRAKMKNKGRGKKLREFKRRQRTPIER